MAKTKQGMSELLGMYITKKQLKGQFIPRINRSFIMQMKNRAEGKKTEGMKKKKTHTFYYLFCVKVCEAQISHMLFHLMHLTKE